MTFELKMTEQQAVDGLKKLYGTEFTTADVRAFSAMNGIGYGTVTKKIKKYKVGKGKWNLEVTTEAVENIEKSFSSPAVEPSFKEDLVPEKDSTFIKFGNFADVKNIIKSGFNVIATANTKGKGSDDGRFIGTNVLNEAFLERLNLLLHHHRMFYE